MSTRPRQDPPVNVQGTLRRSKRLIERFGDKEADDEPSVKVTKRESGSSKFGGKRKRTSTVADPVVQGQDLSSEEEFQAVPLSKQFRAQTKAQAASVQGTKHKTVKGGKSTVAWKSSGKQKITGKNLSQDLLTSVSYKSEVASVSTSISITGQSKSKSEGKPSAGEQPAGQSSSKSQEESADSKSADSKSADSKTPAGEFHSLRSRLRSLSKRRRGKSTAEADKADSEPKKGSQLSATVTTKDTGCSTSCCQGLAADQAANPGAELLSSTGITDQPSSSTDHLGWSESRRIAMMDSQSTETSMETSQSASASAMTDEGGDLVQLHALLEARGLRPELLDALGARGMHHLFGRLPPMSSTSGTMSRVNQLMTGIEASHDETLQLQSVIELCQMLVMGNEDTLGCFPVKQAVPALIQLMRIEHNLDMMNHACRALTYMMEALPRSSAVVVDAIPVFLEKLQVIQCMDVAEQALTALEMLSRRHGKAILNAGGINACLLYLDFFSINAQRAAVTVAANCCQFVTVEDFPRIVDCIPVLSARLQNNDKKSVESSCLCFTRLVDSVHSQNKFLVELASHGLLSNLQQLIIISPSIITTNTFTMVIRMLHIMCSHCPSLAVQLLKQKMADTVRYLLVGTSEYTSSESLELVSRSPGELYELVALISAMLPTLPSDGIFSIDALLKSAESAAQSQSMWQWKDNSGVWHLYSRADSHVIELAFQAGEEEVAVTIMGRNYAIDFLALQQINEDTGTSRAIQRKAVVNISPTPVLTSSESRVQDDRNVAFAEQNEITAMFMKSLFPTLYCVYNSSAGPGIRHMCVAGLLRMLYFSSPEVLNDVLEAYPVSSQVAALLGSRDQKVVVSALQMAHILIEKLPDVFKIYFRKEGVMHEIERLAALATSTPETSNSHRAATDAAMTDKTFPCETNDDEIQTQELLNPSPSQASASYSPPMTRRRFSDMLRRRHARQTSKDDSSPPQSRASTSDLTTKGSSVGRTFRFGKKLKDAASGKTTGSVSSGSGDKEKVALWIKENAAKFLSVCASTGALSDNPALNVLGRLEKAVQELRPGGKPEVNLTALEEIHSVITDQQVSVSSFEILHCGLIPKLLSFLTSSSRRDKMPRSDRAQQFLRVFLQLTGRKDDFTTQSTVLNLDSLTTLIHKLHGCTNQLEQFPVRVHEGASSTGLARGSQTMQFFNTHQLKCVLQRHPSARCLREWKGGTVKVDPLASVQAIERYLYVRGYAKPRQGAESQSEGDESEDEIDDAMATAFSGPGPHQHKLEFLLNGNILSYSMTVFQAVKQYSKRGDETEESGDEHNLLGRPNIWIDTHTIQYRPTDVLEKELQDSGLISLLDMLPNVTPSLTDSSRASASSGKGKRDKASTKEVKSSVKRSGRRQGSGRTKRGATSTSKVITANERKTSVDLSSDGNKALADHLLTTAAINSISYNDPSTPVLNLIHVLHVLSAHLSVFCDSCSSNSSVVLAQEFVNSKLTAKATRQLQDPVVIMTGNFPVWLLELSRTCSFLFPFDVRQQLLYCSAFDRDRAMARIQELQPELAAHESIDRLVTQLEKRKRSVSRSDLFKQAENIMNELSSSKAVLEVNFSSEVGTGLGPTLEFYTLVSRELQRADFNMWRGEILPLPEGTAVMGDASDCLYVYSPNGLYPACIGKECDKDVHAALLDKFSFLGKFLAKAILDSRLIDIPLSTAFYKWILNQEATLSRSDLQEVDPVLGRSYTQLWDVAVKKQAIEDDSQLLPEEKDTKIKELTVDGCSIEDLHLDFRLPGNDAIELKSGGKDVVVTVENLDEYLQLLCRWSLVDGVADQFQAFRDGFNAVFPLSTLQMFDPHEMGELLCGSEHDKWDCKGLVEHCRPDHGYTHDSRAVQMLFEIMSTYDSQDQRSFLQFVTGSPRLPVGGFKSLNPPLTIVRKAIESPLNPDEFLPSVMTCVNYLKLPDYSSQDVMRAKLHQASSEGQQSFHLS
ncbi:E3 ubiquitin-protein ligase TRIP12-like isoform X2 [Corticium candelabrum]|uniref:E3 ubiquitin-protein ligase TRIP12-like isoform X2 n=1 Tax=Corticium candelabrum TaxID=121492 RepID=UPI002E2740A8|nr:E3 ubiquitin-protein ligase TRIP12-like isoform X2 [Corticium candelabrum]